MDNENDTPTDRPLGYWLRTVDALLTREFARAFEGEQTDRRDWMLLNAVAGTVDAPGLTDRLTRGGKRLRRLEDRGWITQSGDGTWSLTDEGRAARERLGAVVDGIRDRVAAAVSPEDFATTMTSLQAIATELGWDENAPLRGVGRQGFGRGRFGHRGFGMHRHQGGCAGHGHGHGHDHGHDHGHGHGHGHDRDERRDPRAAERAYERGFAAGFTRAQGA